MDQYLIQILKETNTIIIPDLGALTITSEEQNEIMLMPFLKHDDGKLANHIAKKRGLMVLKPKTLSPNMFVKSRQNWIKVIPM
jgi:hypothetical protein